MNNYAPGPLCAPYPEGEADRVLPDNTMYTDILINATSYENRIALVENGNLREFHLERLS